MEKEKKKNSWAKGIASKIWCRFYEICTKYFMVAIAIGVYRDFPYTCQNTN